jgi:hypothetical protein
MGGSTERTRFEGITERHVHSPRRDAARQRAKQNIFEAPRRVKPAQGGHHIGTFPQLEDQMTNFTSDIDRAAAGYSPDRVDALVWAFSELLVEPMKGEAIFELARRNAEAAEQRRKPQPTQTVPQPGSVEWFQAQKKKG